MRIDSLSLIFNIFICVCESVESPLSCGLIIVTKYINNVNQNILKLLFFSFTYGVGDTADVIVSLRR